MFLDERICVSTICRLIVLFAISNTAAGQAATAIAVLSSHKGVTGTITFTQEFGGRTTVTGNLAGLTPGLHGFHVHTLGDISDNCKNTGPHLNPAGLQHGAPDDLIRHAGDLGNINVGDDGTVNFTLVDGQIPLIGLNSILGRAVVVHALPDDLGRGNNLESKITGNAGEKIACGVIGRQDEFFLFQ